MKIKTWIKYEESYLPPRCRKLRYRECEEYINVNLREVPMDELKLAFEDNSYSGKGKIYLYRGKLWCKEKMYHGAAEYGCKTALEWLIFCNENCSTFFKFASDRVCSGEDTSREAVVKLARNSMIGYILVDGELYVQTAEPRYCIYTFGLGHNHGGTSLSVDYRYNSNISNERYFSALDGQKAVEEANRIAAARGDTNYVGKFEPEIIVYMPECVTISPAKEHGNGYEFINSIESIINCSDSAAEAGLLCIATTMGNML